MPELPEVETVVRDLRAPLTGLRITRVAIRWAGSISAPDPVTFVREVTGRCVTGIERRGKWIVLKLCGGAALLVHLRMTGQLVLEPADVPDDAYARLILSLDHGQRLRFSDMRKLGRWVLTDDVEKVLGDLGPEPLAAGFSVDAFATMLAQRRGRIKPLLLNQRFLAGMGNIYVNEALWRARIHPLRPANSLSSEEVAALHRAVRTVLQAAIGEGGTTLENGNFRRADGGTGGFAGQLLVYGREGEACVACGEPVERITVGQRGTYLCPCCQLSAD
jgi:formamidopyrimidine-DNA glycosylase